jgi:hypothetical protein
MSVCIRTQRGAVLGQRHMQTRPDPFLPVMAPSRQAMVVAVACRCPWDWLADRWADAGSPFVLGQALSMQALPGGTAKTDPRDSHKRAAVRRGGTLPQADGSPAPRHATRDVLRRWRPLAHQRAALCAQVHHTTSQAHLPALGQTIAATAPRDGGS